MDVIEVAHLQKDYGNKKGVFNVSFTIKKGEIYGFLGPNGAGKTTTIRHLLGFIRPDEGEVKIKGMDCFKEAPIIHNDLGYLPGEISFPSNMSGKSFINMMADIRHMKDRSKIEELMERFELDASGDIKRMSKGMKQKIGIVCAFMHDPSVLILDEPTSGLDPLMQSRFIQLLEEEKAKGKTILLSSHIFEEVEKTCDRIAIIRNGHIVTENESKQLHEQRSKKYIFEVSDLQEKEKLLKSEFMNRYADINGDIITVTINDRYVNLFIKELSNYNLKYLKEDTQTLEDYFMQFYGGAHHD